MSGEKGVFVFGYSGHSYVVIDTALSMGLDILGYFEYKENNLNPYGIKYMGNERELDWNNLISSNYGFCTIGDNKIRSKIDTSILNAGISRLNIIHPTSSIAKNVSLGKSIFVGPNSIVNSLAEIDDGVILNSGSIVEHECSLGKYSHLAPGAVLTGSVNIGENTLIGANAIVLPGVSIGNNVIVGAGSVITRDIENDEVYIGNPGKKIR